MCKINFWSFLSFRLHQNKIQSRWAVSTNVPKRKGFKLFKYHWAIKEMSAPVIFLKHHSLEVELGHHGDTRSVWEQTENHTDRGEVALKLYKKHTHMERDTGASVQLNAFVWGLSCSPLYSHNHTIMLPQTHTHMHSLLTISHIWKYILCMILKCESKHVHFNTYSTTQKSLDWNVSLDLKKERCKTFVERRIYLVILFLSFWLQHNS